MCLSGIRGRSGSVAGMSFARVSVASMSDDEIARLVDAVRRHYDDGCFACGRDNPIGLHLDGFAFEDGEVSAQFTPRAEFRGAGKSLHGGVAATALDEILVWAGILAEGVLTVTGNIALRYRRPVHVDDTPIVTARVDRRSGRRLEISGALSVDGESRVQASGLYLVTATVEEMLTGDGHS